MSAPDNCKTLRGALMVEMSPVLDGEMFQVWDEHVNNPQNQEWM